MWLICVLKGFFPKVLILKFTRSMKNQVDGIVKNLGDVLFVLGKDSNLSLLAQDCHGCQGNCIYFSYAVGVLCFSLKDSARLKSASPFWPCPSLFH